MRAAESKTPATTFSKNPSFFHSESGPGFFGNNGGVDPFFKKPNAPSVQTKPNRSINAYSSLNQTGSGYSTNASAIQTRLTIGQPGDKYEQEADAMADNVVQRLREPGNEQTRPDNLFNSFTPLIQTKGNSGEEDDKLQKKEYDEELPAESRPEKEIPDLFAVSDGGLQKPSGDFHQQLNSSKGGGSPLDPESRETMGAQFGADFSGVRIHTGSQASEMNKGLNSQAFTHNNDIYFNEGKFNLSTTPGKHLLAHELAHTVQQGAMSQKMIQREGSTKTINSIEKTSDGKMTESENKIRMDLEKFKVKKNLDKEKNPVWKESGVKMPKPGQRSTGQLAVWKKGVRQEVKAEIKEMTSKVSSPDEKYVLEVKKNPGISLAGSLTQIVNDILVPYWDPEGNITTYQVEHILDWQIAGGGDRDVDDIKNLILLDASTNNKLGGLVNKYKKEHIEKVLHHYQKEGAEVEQNADKALKNYDIYVKSVSPDIDVPGSIILQSQLTDKKSIENPFRSDIIDIRNFEVPPKHFLLKTSQRGVEYIVPYNEDGFETGSYKITTIGNAESHQLEKIILDPIIDPENIKKSSDSHTYDVEPKGTDKFLVKNLKSRLRNLFELKLLSPIEFDEENIELLGGMNIYAAGKVLPSVPLLSDADIDIIIQGRNIRVRKLFDFGEIDVPNPFEISSSSLELFAGTEGVGISGQIGFGINQVGEGNVTASVSTSGGFELEGAFNFDSELFDPAAISVEYKDETWTIGGEIGIPEGKVRGIKNATITATYSEGNFEAAGDAELDIPGIERGTMNVQYSDDGFSIGGAFDLSSDIPGIRSGRVEATVSKQSGDEEYNVLVRGTAQPDIPGLSSTLSVEYHNGALTIAGTASYSRGMLSGEISVGATNRTINEEGMPAGEPDDTMRVYGGGSLTLRLTPWLEATAGVKLLPNGEMEVQGRIGLPDTVDVFPRREFRRNLFRAPTIEIPLFAIPVGPRSIGLVAQIGGGLDFSAGFGPGQLRELYAEITYNPDREEETELNGRGMFAIPADAGLTLSGDVSLGVSVAIASLTGGIELAGTLGLEGEASAAVDVNWTPQTGITLDAEGRVMVNPKFLFDVNAFARGKVGIGRLSKSKTWRHNLAGFEWGPDIQFGLVFPVHYKEGEPFSLSFEDIEVIYPDLNIPRMAKGLASDIKDDIF